MTGTRRGSTHRARGPTKTKQHNKRCDCCQVGGIAPKVTFEWHSLAAAVVTGAASLAAHNDAHRRAVRNSSTRIHGARLSSDGRSGKQIAPGSPTTLNATADTATTPAPGPGALRRAAACAPSRPAHWPVAWLIIERNTIYAGSLLATVASEPPACAGAAEASAGPSRRPHRFFDIASPVPSGFGYYKGRRRIGNRWRRSGLVVDKRKQSFHLYAPKSPKSSFSKNGSTTGSCEKIQKKKTISSNTSDTILKHISLFSDYFTKSIFMVITLSR